MWWLGRIELGNEVLFEEEAGKEIEKCKMKCDDQNAKLWKFGKTMMSHSTKGYAIA